jgi:hypothetical protein
MSKFLVRGSNAQFKSRFLFALLVLFILLYTLLFYFFGAISMRAGYFFSANSGRGEFFVLSEMWNLQVYLWMSGVFGGVMLAAYFCKAREVRGGGAFNCQFPEGP